MTKDELIEEIINIPGHYEVCVHCGFDARDPSGLHKVVSVKEHRIHNTIELEMADE